MRWIWLVAGILSAQQARDLAWEPGPPANVLGDAGTRWALVVGVSRHENLPAAAQLRFAHRDAEEFGGFLLTAGGGALPPDHVKVLTDERATLAEIRAALHSWLPAVAKPQDVVYVFFAGHVVVAEREEGYFVAHDSDPQNLHSTGLSFAEVEETLARRTRAKLVVMMADACHAGQLGWSSYSGTGAGKAAGQLEKLGDRSFLKILSARPSEQSFEDARWNGGVFTYALLSGLRGASDRDGDKVVRASEVIDFLAERVPAETASRQNPRVAGTFDARLALATVPSAAPAGAMALEIDGPDGVGVYVDHVFRGSLRTGRRLRVDGLAEGVHRVGADTGFEGMVKLNAPVSLFRLPLAKAERRVAELETAGQACVSDYVASTAAGPKRILLEKAVAALTELRQLRPQDGSIETRRLFCLGRLQIAANRFTEAEGSLRAALGRDPQFACARNALGVALGRQGRGAEARAEFEKAAELTPEWALPLVQVGNLLLAGGKVKDALEYFEEAVKLQPESRANRAALVRGYRAAGKTGEARRGAEELIQLDPSYAPAHLELARTLEAQGDALGAAGAYEAYLLLAPNYGDSEEIRARTGRLKATGSGTAPTLKRK